MPTKKQPKLVCQFPLAPASIVGPAVTCNGYPARRATPASLPLCNVHERQVQVQGLPPTTAQRVANAAASSFASSFNVGQFVAGLVGGFTQTQQSAPPPAAAAGGMSPTLARLVMRFDAGEVLTVDKVKARKRELAGKYHPDREGGDHTAMQELNAAADLLLASL